MLHTRGIRLHAAEAGEQDAPLVLLLHGSFGGWFDFKDTLAPLAEAGAHAAALDLRGYGMSDKPAARAGDILHILAGDVAGAIRTLGHTQALVVGADTGGVIARAAAQRYPDLVPRAIALPTSRGLATTASRIHPGVLSRSERALDALWRSNLLADTTEAFHTDPRFNEFLELRLAARRIDNALPHIVATSRLRPRAPHAGGLPELGPSRLPHVEDAGAFAAVVVKQAP